MGVLDVLDLGRLLAHALEEGRVLDVGRVVVPLVDLAFRHLDGLPHLVAVEHLGVFLAEHLGVDLLHRLGDLGLGGPDVLEVDRLAVAAFTDGVIVQVAAHITGQGEGHHQGR